ncbi:type 2 lantibiotic biosynthesis protein LanM [Rivularia sp. PCC 7116]|uniref:type 2 lanthipeptide synthetase LanM family protein n=1 Tax=Rivularia sp. PCC 7116 TaxID=373994 RepID=UPI00029ED343|nr:type 2 lanthipeptide synthetase LanM family protein [Rivularia sp. PCC 7116]AFY58609.1 type 2 lantibiotic biosynthesis protein LanM [Rivularia sp. PCC 7116]
MLATEPLKLDSYLRTLVNKASYLTERLNQDVVPTVSKSDESTINSHLEFWCQVLAKGNKEQFQRRLAADKLDIDKLHTLLGEVEYPQSQPLPAWGQTLKLVLQAAQKPLNTELSDFSSENPIPFEPFYQPFIQVAQNQLLSRVDLDILGEDAQKTLWISLLDRLRNIAIKTLFTEFAEFRSSGNSLKDFFLIQLQGKNSQEKYHAFLKHLFQDGLLGLFEKYPVLAKLLATAIDYWVDATVEFINRLRTDLPAIEKLFSPDTALQKVVELKANLSDLHNQGRSATALTFDTGLKLVYKPKDVEMELAYNKIISWCNENGSPLPLKTFTVLSQAKYGWVEFVYQDDCPDEAAAERYYQRAGMILAIMHLLLATDCHHENLIASGEHPVLIDLETLLTHQTTKSHDSNSEIPQSAFDILDKQLEKSLIRTMLLPQKGLIAKDSVEIDLSGFGGVEEYKSAMPKLRYVNTDGMNIAYEIISIESHANVPKVNGVNLSPLSYVESLVTGFEQMYRFLKNQKQALLKPGSPLMELANQKVRYVFRATHIYHSIIQDSYSPEYLDSGIKRSLALEVLARAFVVNEAMLNRISILNAERQAAEDGDIPFFAVNTSESNLPLPTQEVVTDLFIQPSFTAAINQLENLNQTNLAQQVAVIRGTFAARYTKEPALSANSVAVNFKENLKEDVIAPDIFVEQAITLANELKQTATFGEDGSVAWLGLGYRTTTEGFLFQPLGSNLYDGNCGIALFLAALAKITQDSQWSNLASHSLQPLLQIHKTESSERLARFTRKMGIGGATGLASIAYTLVHTSKLLADNNLLTTAKNIALLITPESIASEKYFDITRGVAGAILGLLAVYKTNPEDKRLLDLAINCGEHLLKQQISINEYKTWKTWNGIALTGFSQGAGGIAYALLNLCKITAREEFLQAAKEAIAYEKSCFCEEAGNWQDLRTENNQYQVSWAHGAAGIALARINSLSILNTPEIIAEINTALETTQKCGISTVDNLAWGNFGRIETLLVAAQVLNRPELLQIARNSSIKLVEQAREKGGFRLYSNILSPVFNPAFLHGTSGIGYQLLRLAYPELPSILSFEF